jgi:hypothetical protein
MNLKREATYTATGLAILTAMTAIVMLYILFAMAYPTAAVLLFFGGILLIYARFFGGLVYDNSIKPR